MVGFDEMPSRSVVSFSEATPPPEATVVDTHLEDVFIGRGYKEPSLLASSMKRFKKSLTLTHAALPLSIYL